MSSVESDRLLIDRVRSHDAAAWQELIDRFEGRLLAYVRGRLPRDQAEDVVQETFIGFLHSLPHYDASRPLESYLLSIAAHKLTDHLRFHGRRPSVPLGSSSGSGSNEISGPARAASSMYRSRERRQFEEQALTAALTDQIDHYRRRGDWEKLKVAELIFVRGWANKRVAEQLDLSEQRVANVKFEFIARVRALIGRQGIVPEELLGEEA